MSGLAVISRKTSQQHSELLHALVASPRLRFTAVTLQPRILPQLAASVTFAAGKACTWHGGDRPAGFRDGDAQAPRPLSKAGQARLKQGMANNSQSRTKCLAPAHLAIAVHVWASTRCNLAFSAILHG